MAWCIWQIKKCAASDMEFLFFHLKSWRKALEAPFLPSHTYRVTHLKWPAAAMRSTHAFSDFISFACHDKPTTFVHLIIPKNKHDALFKIVKDLSITATIFLDFLRFCNVPPKIETQKKLVFQNPWVIRAFEQPSNNRLIEMGNCV